MFFLTVVFTLLSCSAVAGKASGKQLYAVSPFSTMETCSSLSAVDGLSYWLAFHKDVMPGRSQHVQNTLVLPLIASKPTMILCVYAVVFARELRVQPKWTCHTLNTHQQISQLHP